MNTTTNQQLWCAKMADADVCLTAPQGEAAVVRLVGADDQYRSVGSLPAATGAALSPPDSPSTPCRTCCWLVVLLLLVLPLLIMLLLSIVPILIMQLLGLRMGRMPVPLNGGDPQRPRSRIAGSEFLVLRDGRQLEYMVCGPADGVPAVFIHGWGASCPMFAKDYFQAIFAAHKLRVYSVSMPGWGLSDSSPHHRGWACWLRHRVVGRPLSEFVEDIRELAERVIDVDAAAAGSSATRKQLQQPKGHVADDKETVVAAAASADVAPLLPRTAVAPPNTAAVTEPPPTKFVVCGFSMGAAHAAAVGAGLPSRVRACGIFGPTDPHAGDAYDCSCACCAKRAHPRWQGPPGCFSMIRLASFCRPLVLSPAADAFFAILIWALLGNGQLVRMLPPFLPPLLLLLLLHVLPLLLLLLPSSLPPSIPPGKV